MILVIGYIMIFSTTSFKGLSEFSVPIILLAPLDLFIGRNTLFFIEVIQQHV